ncbi:hypothetical protein HK101_006088, partial [Irineochytrium annulatum]
APGYYSSPITPATFLDCFAHGSCTGNDTCSAQYAGPRCVYCADGYVNSNGRCIECDAGGSVALALFCVFLVMFMPAWWLNRAWLNASSAALGNLLMFVQVVGLFQKYPINWNGYLSEVVNVLSVSILNTDYLNFQCAFGMSFYSRILSVWFLPVLIAVMIKLYVVIMAHWLHLRHGVAHEMTYEKWNRYSLYAFICFLALLHIPLTDRSLRLFTCVQDPNDNRSYVSGIHHFHFNTIAVTSINPPTKGNPDITCYDDTWYIYRPMSIFFALIYGAGIPFGFLAILYRNRHILDSDFVVQSFGGLYSSYRKGVWWWSPFQILWSLCFMMLPVLFRKHATYLLFTSVCLMYLYLSILFYVKPFRNPLNNAISALGWITTVLFLFGQVIIGLLAGASQDDPTPILFVIAAMFDLTCVVMVHAVFHEWCVVSGPGWRRSSWVMAQVMDSRVWGLFFPDGRGPPPPGGAATRAEQQSREDATAVKMRKIASGSGDDVTKSNDVTMLDLQSGEELAIVPPPAGARDAEMGMGNAVDDDILERARDSVAALEAGRGDTMGLVSALA